MFVSGWVCVWVCGYWVGLCVGVWVLGGWVCLCQLDYRTDQVSAKGIFIGNFYFMNGLHRDTSCTHSEYSINSSSSLLGWISGTLLDISHLYNISYCLRALLLSGGNKLMGNQFLKLKTIGFSNSR